MAKQQNLEQIAQFVKDFLGIQRKIMFFLTEFALDYYFQLNYFKHLEEYSEFSIKILNFSGALGASPPILLILIVN